MRKRIALVVSFIYASALVCYGQHINRADFTRPDSVADALHGHSIIDLGVLSNQLTKGLNTELEKFRAIYYWVCHNIESNYDLFVENKRQREKLQGRPHELRAWNQQLIDRAFRLLINERSTVCSGYAYLVRELSLHAGIKCEIVDGYGRTVISNIGGKGIANHTWNAVKLEGNWYLCDATWSSGMLDTRERTFIRKFEPAYFLADPALFARSHFPLDTTWLRLDHKPSLEDFLNGPIIYAGAFRSEIFAVAPETLNITINKKEKVLFEFSTPATTTKNITLRIGNAMNGTQAARTDIGGEVRYTFEQAFRARGSYAVHVISGDHVLYTYHVTVR